MNCTVRLQLILHGSRVHLLRLMAHKLQAVAECDLLMGRRELETLNARQRLRYGLVGRCHPPSISAGLKRRR